MILISLRSVSRLGFSPTHGNAIFFSGAQDCEADVEITDRVRIAIAKVNVTPFRFIGGLVNDGQRLKFMPFNTARSGELSAAVEVVGKIAGLFMRERFIILRSAAFQLLKDVRGEFAARNAGWPQSPGALLPGR